VCCVQSFIWHLYLDWSHVSVRSLSLSLLFFLLITQKHTNKSHVRSCNSMDITNYGEGLESLDSGFAATMAVIAMNERLNNPVLRVFTRIMMQSCRRNGNASSNETKSPFVTKRKNRNKARDRWFLAYTLVKNPSLVKYRKRYRCRKMLCDDDDTGYDNDTKEREAMKEIPSDPKWRERPKEQKCEV